ncbi:MAG: DNA starvation/stationary phase protection protein Dps [Chloroflexi bacterium]|nr:DNA starvation/stationary phase protection protein Dps [Chloroflexota bacterium]
MATLTTFKTSNDLPMDVRGHMITLLNQNLADMSDLYSQTKQAHWNVKGRNFIALHELFDKLAGEVIGYVDDIAERTTELGGYATGTNRMSASASRVSEYPTEAVEGMEHVSALVERYALVAKNVRAAINIATEAGDADTADLLTEISRDMDKWVWFLEAHLQA